MKWDDNRMIGMAWSFGILLLALTVWSPLFPTECRAAMGVSQSKHNLSVSGPGTVKAVSETRICIFCHTPHNAEPVGILWNRKDPTTVYTTYQSTSAQTFIGQPTGASRLCLSCHDGTIALGELTSEPVEVSMTQRFLDVGPTAIGTDLSDDHPISFVYDTTLSASNPQFVDPTLLIDAVRLDRNNELQCTSCHDPHDNSYGHFLVMNNQFSALCVTCHQPTGWSTSTHKLSTAVWNGTPPTPWPSSGAQARTPYISVNENGCENCHRPHSAGTHPRILNYPNEEDNCFPCHNGNVASLNIEAEFSKADVHPVTSTTGIHDPTENFQTMQRHVECTDCHNPHRVRNAPAAAPSVGGRLEGVSGVSSAGLAVINSTYQYEICYKCHGDTAQGFLPVTRQIPELNKRLQFNLTNPSYHPVEGAGQNPNVPSLLPGYTTGSIIYCTDCHNNDSGPGAGGQGPNGPHGSRWPYLLEREYITADNTGETANVYALCYKCHDRNSILADASGFPHSIHLQVANASCSVCHDPHGVSDTLGNPTNNSHLINFDTSVVFPVGMNSGPVFEDQGTFKGRCFLTCHTKMHNPKSY